MTWSEVPTTPPEQPLNGQPQQPGWQPGSQQPPKAPKKRHGCLIGCLVVILALIVAAVITGLFAKHEYDSWVNGDSTTTTTNPNAPKPVEVTTAQYAQLVASHSTVLEDDGTKVANACKNVVNDKAPCQTAIGAFHTDLAAFQTDLNGVTAPAALSKTDAQLRKSVNDGLNGSGNISTGLNGHPLTLLKGITEVGKSSDELDQAVQQLNSAIGTSTTMTT